MSERPKRYLNIRAYEDDFKRWQTLLCLRKRRSSEVSAADLFKEMLDAYESELRRYGLGVELLS